MNKTKEKILDVSKGLFNKLGVSQVTIRMIAQELKMSSGNLNYHFRKRKDILEQLYFQMVEQFDQRLKNLNQEALSLKRMKEDIFLSMQRMLEYKFFWTDLYYLLRQSSSIQEHFNQALLKRKEGYAYLLTYFQKEGILEPADFEKEYEYLVERMIDYSNTFLYSSVLYDENSLNEQYLHHSTAVLMLNLYPYLTEKGKREYRRLYPNSFAVL